MKILSDFLNDPIMAMWFLISGSFFFLALFSFRVWLDIRGIRGVAISTLAISCGLLAMLLGVARSPDARLSWTFILIGLRPLFVLMLLSCAVIVDLWAADHNDHRSVTTITYQWFKRMTIERDIKRHSATVRHAGG